MTNKACTIDQTQRNVIYGVRITILAVSIILLACTLILIYTYIIKKRRYRDVNDLLFYINAVLIIVSTGLVSGVTKMPDENICAFSWLIYNKLPDFLNLNLGIC